MTADLALFLWTGWMLSMASLSTALIVLLWTTRPVPVTLPRAWVVKR